MKTRTAAVSAGVVAGALAAGVIGSALVRRRHPREVEPLGPPPPEDLGPVASFDGTELAVRAAGDPDAPVVLLAHGYLCLRAMGRDLAAVLEAVAPDRRAVVVGHSMGAVAILALAEQRPELFGPRIAGVALIGAASSDLLGGAMGSVTELLRPRLGSLQAAAKRVDGLRRVVLAGPTGLSGVVARVTQFGPNAPKDVVDHVVALAQSTASEVWTDALPELMGRGL